MIHVHKTHLKLRNKKSCFHFPKWIPSSVVLLNILANIGVNLMAKPSTTLFTGVE